MIDYGSLVALIVTMHMIRSIPVMTDIVWCVRGVIQKFTERILLITIQEYSEISQSFKISQALANRG